MDTQEVAQRRRRDLQKIGGYRQKIQEKNNERRKAKAKKTRSKLWSIKRVNKLAAQSDRHLQKDRRGKKEEEKNR